MPNAQAELSVHDIAKDIAAQVEAAGGVTRLSGSKTSFGRSSYVDAAFWAGRRYVRANIRVSDHDCGLARYVDHMHVGVRDGRVTFGMDDVAELIRRGRELQAALGATNGPSQ